MNDEQSVDEPTAGEALKAPVGAPSSPSSPPPSIAPRPHWVTILLGLMSPAAAIAAVYISMQGLATSQASLETSRTSMKVAQRAYLSIRNGQIAQIKRPTEAPPGYTSTLEYAWQFEIQNLGQTPASNIDYKIEYDLPKGWATAPELEGWVDAAQGRVRDLAQGTHIEQYQGAAFYLTKEAATAWEGSGWPEPEEVLLKAHGVLVYRDVFNDKHEIAWCWQEAGPNHGSRIGSKRMRPATNCPRPLE